MPEYTFICDGCGEKFSLCLSIKEYSDKQKCPSCKSSKTYRSYVDDMVNMTGSVVKSDSELKLGDLANRNRDRMTDDHKAHLYEKHNSYKETSSQPLPKGMSRLNKQPRIEWPK